MATITKYTTKTGPRYRVRYRKPDGTQTDKRGFTTKRDAQLFLATTEVAKSRGEYIDPTHSRITINTLGKEWVTHQSHLKPSSLKPLEVSWRVHVQPRWGDRTITTIRHSEIQTWITELAQRRSATIVIRAHSILAGILDTAVKDRRLSTNPARGINLPRKTRKRHTYLTHEQVHALADASGDHRTLVLTLAYTGLRWGEAIGLRVKDLDVLRQRINVTVNAVEVAGEIIVGTPKTHKLRSVPFPAFLTEPLARQCEGKSRDDLVFSDKHGQHLRRTRASSGSRSWFKTALATAVIEPMTLHDLRHTAASLAISAGTNVKAVQRMLGHASAAMTLDTYADLFDDDLDAVAERLNAEVVQSSVGKMWARRAESE